MKKQVEEESEKVSLRMEDALCQSVVLALIRLLLGGGEYGHPVGLR